MKTIDVTVPNDGAVIGKDSISAGSVVEAALSTAHALYRDRDGWIPTSRRSAILWNALELIRERRDELALQSAREGGKPLVDSRVELDRAVDGVGGIPHTIHDMRTEKMMVLRSDEL